MHQIIEKTEKLWKETTKYLSQKKKEFNKSIKPSRIIDVIRWAIIAVIILAALSVITSFIIHGAILLVLSIVIYFLMPLGFLEEVTTKMHKPAAKIENKMAKPLKKTKKTSKPKAKKTKKTEKIKITNP